MIKLSHKKAKKRFENRRPLWYAPINSQFKFAPIKWHYSSQKWPFINNLFNWYITPELASKLGKLFYE